MKFLGDNLKPGQVAVDGKVLREGIDYEITEDGSIQLKGKYVSV